MERIPRPNEIYRHFKGNLYKVITLARHSETGERMVVYQALYEDLEIFVRPLELFTDEVDREKYPFATAKYRFELVPEILGQGSAVSERAAAEDEDSEDDAAEDEDSENDAAALDPMLLKFLDADTYREKLEIFVRMHSQITDHMLNAMAVSLDLELEEGDLEERYQSLKNCILTLERYECDRLR